MALARCTGAQFADHHDPSMETNTQLDLAADFLPPERVQRCHPGDHRAGCPHRADRIVLACRGVAEIGEHTVAEEFGQDTAHAADRLGGHCLIGSEQVP